jgi:hypothetical protein
MKLIQNRAPLVISLAPAVLASEVAIVHAHEVVTRQQHGQNDRFDGESGGIAGDLVNACGKQASHEDSLDCQRGQAE